MDIIKNQAFGYLEVVPKPSNAELKEYYANKYYQDPKPRYYYSHFYSDEELKYKANKLKQKSYILEEILDSDGPKKIIDLGCGEGFTLDYFNKKKWDVLGLDHSNFSISNFHPHLLTNFIQCDLFEEIEKLITDNRTFDVIILDNVLEHVIDPIKLIDSCYKILNQNGILVIEVPNDYSKFQKFLIAKNIVSKEYWLAVPDHLSYFSKESLIKLCESKNFKTKKVIADFPIEWYLVNTHSNYVEDRNRGKVAHESRLFIENFLDHENKMDSLISFYEKLADIGQGRILTGFFQK